MEIANVVLPTRRTFHSFTGGGVASFPIRPPQSVLIHGIERIIQEKCLEGVTGCSIEWWMHVLDSRPEESGIKVQAFPHNPARSNYPMSVHNYLAASMEVTVMTLPFSVPVTVTFSPANSAGFF